MRAWSVALLGLGSGLAGASVVAALMVTLDTQRRVDLAFDRIESHERRVTAAESARWEADRRALAAADTASRVNDEWTRAKAQLPTAQDVMALRLELQRLAPEPSRPIAASQPGGPQPEQSVIERLRAQVARQGLPPMPSPPPLPPRP